MYAMVWSVLWTVAIILAAVSVSVAATASPFSVRWTVGSGFISVSPAGDLMQVPLGTFGQNGTAISRSADAAQLWTSSERFMGWDNSGARTFWGAALRSGDWVLRDAYTGAALFGGTVDPPASAQYPCYGLVSSWFSPDDALLFIGYVDNTTSAARTLAYRVADGVLVHNSSLAGVYPPAMGICNNIGEAAFVPAAANARGVDLMITVWLSQPGDNSPATIAQVMTTGEYLWLSNVEPHAVSPPLWAFGMLLLPWTPCAFGEGGGVHVLSVENGTRVAGGAYYCKECAGEFDGPDSELFVIQGFNDGQYVATGLQFLNVSNGFSEAFVAPARPIAGDDDHVCEYGCFDSVFGWTYSADTRAVVVAQAGPVASVKQPGDVAAWYAGYQVVNGSTAAWQLEVPGAGWGSFAVVDTSAGEVLVAVHGAYTFVADAKNGLVLWNGTTPVAGASRLTLCPWPACVLVQCGEQCTVMIDVVM